MRLELVPELMRIYGKFSESGINLINRRES